MTIRTAAILSLAVVIGMVIGSTLADIERSLKPNPPPLTYCFHKEMGLYQQCKDVPWEGRA